MKREEAYKILTTYLKNANLIKHCLAAETAMKGLCIYLNPNASSEEIEKWGITGLLHDADYEIYDGNPAKHGMVITEKVELPKDIAHAINSHNFQNTGVEPESPMDWAITCADQLTGLIVACALVHPARNASASVAGEPEKKLEPLTPEFVLKRLGEKAFARGADRSVISLCEEKLGIPLDKFIEIVLSSMKDISADLGL